MWRFAAAAWACLLVAPAAGGAAAQAERRVALVIGNGAYRDAPLNNPANDAKAVTEALSRLGFQVVSGIDLDQQGMAAKIREFGKAAQGAEFAVMFYAGHGMQVSGRNYLIPTSARIEREQDLLWETIPADTLLQEAAGVTRLRLVILDACRNNPFEARLARSMGTRASALGRGLARITADSPGNTLIAFATRTDDVADDGQGRDSPFTTALLQHLETPGLEVRLLFGKVRDSVLKATGGKQDPWIDASIGGSEIFLRAAPAPPPPPPPAPVPAPARPPASSAVMLDRDALFWQSIGSSKRAEDFQLYLDAFPNGTFVGLARSRIAALTIPPQAGPTPPPPVAAQPDETRWSADERRAVQSALRTLGHLQAGADAVLGPSTRAAIKQYQSFAGMPDTGILSNSEAGQLKEQGQRLSDLLVRPAVSPAGVPARSVTGAGQRYARAWAFGKGNGVGVDPNEAAYWYGLAASEDNAKAFTNLGVLMARGAVGGSADADAAVLLWHAAAARGEVSSMYDLGIFYEKGPNNTPDLTKARYWYARAASRNHANAQGALRRLGQ